MSSAIRSAVAIGVLAVAGLAAPARAEHERGRSLSRATYERLRELGHELDEIASHAALQAERDQAGQRVRDTKFLRSIRNFSRRAGAFHQRIDDYQSSPWNVDEELERLLRDARNVQDRIRRARFADPHTRDDWNQVVRLLGDMTQIYRYGERYEGFRRDPYHNDRTSGSIGAFDSNRYRDGFQTNSAEMRRLARELENRAERAGHLAGRYAASDIEHFQGQARAFRQRLETTAIPPDELREAVEHLFEDARGAQERIGSLRVSTDVAAEWNGIMRVLTRMRELTGDRDPQSHP